MDDDFDSIWNTVTGGANYAPGEEAMDWSNNVYEIDVGGLNPGDEGYNWRYFSDGTAISPEGVYYYGGNEVYNPQSPTTFTSLLTEAAKKLPSQTLDAIKGALFKQDGSFNPAALGTLAAAVYGMSGGFDVKTGGYSKPVPKTTAVREQVPMADQGRQPGAAGRRYFSDTTFVPEGGDVGAARTAAQEQAQGLASLQQERQQAQPPAPQPMNIPTPWAKTAEEKMRERVGMAAGGSVPNFRGTLEEGGFVVPGDVVRHADPSGMARKEAGLAALNRALGAEAIRGPGDAMSDSIPTTIEGRQPAAVANGEAYVPRQNVARIAGGNVKKGADKLYDMMERLRLERTGSKAQINPDNPQELVRAYKGGQIKRFADGGITSATATAPQTTAEPVGYGSSQYNTLSPWAGDYVTDALSKGQALANAPYQAYTGPLTAGPTGMQQQAFAGIQQLAGTGFTPETYQAPQMFTGQLAQQYMNPFVDAALQPQLQEMQRQADIARLDDAARLTKAGAFGGSRQAIMESEGRRNLMDMQRRAIGEGMLGAFERGREQFNLDTRGRQEAQKLGEESRRYSSEFGLRSLADMASMGEAQRAIQQAGMDADRQQFEEEREWAYRMPQYQLGLLQGIPIGGSVTEPNMTGLASLQSQLADLGAIYRSIQGLGS